MPIQKELIVSCPLGTIEEGKLATEQLLKSSNPPDAILQEVWKRTGDKPFRHIDDVISQAELAALLKRYQRVAGFDRERLEANA